jgi:hypothetical protein
MTNLVMITAIVLSSIFSVSTVNEIPLNLKESYSCSPPNSIRGVLFGGSSQGMMDATAAILGGADGYEWIITNGFICYSSTDTQTVTICVDCDVPYTGNSITVTASVRAYNIGSGGSKCYTAWKSNTFQWDGPCFYVI